jgi:YD repeat-containing protein
VAGLSRCADHLAPTVTPGADKLRIKTITQEEPNNTAKVSLFQYDAQVRLSSILAYQTPDSTLAPVEKSVYQYNAQNQLIELKRDVVRRANAFGANTELYTYTYNAAGQVVQVRYTNNNPNGGVWLLNPEYDAANRLTSARESFDTGGLTTHENIIFTFTGDNLTEANTTGTINVNQTVMNGSRMDKLTHDSQINPFYGVVVIPAPSIFASIPTTPLIAYYTYYGGIANLLALSRNNVLSDGINTYTYTYNSANLPTSRITTKGGSVTETLRFAYETYL